MTPLVIRSLQYYWRTNLAVISGVAVAVSVLSGALLVGTSVRGSLRDLVAQRLGATDVVVASDRFFREDLADELLSGVNVSGAIACPIIRLDGVLAREGASRRSRAVQVYGVDDRFWTFHGLSRSGPEGRTTLVGKPLADALGIQSGDTLLLRLETSGAVPRESLYGRRDLVGRTIRLTSGGVLEADELGQFALQSSQEDVLAVFVPLARLQRDLGEPSRANTILVASSPVTRPTRAQPSRSPSTRAAPPFDRAQGGLSERVERPDPGSRASDPDAVRSALNRAFTLQDAGVTIRRVPRQQRLTVESARILLDERLAAAATDAAADAGFVSSGVFSYLANAIRGNGREIPYSVVTAAVLGRGALTALRAVGAGAPPASPVAPDESIWLNEWAWRELGVSRGDPIELDYYRWREDGRLTTETAHFRLAGVVAIDGDVDGSLAPAVPGISDARDMRGWDPPFPMDLGRIRQVDEDYWHQYRATPKAFITLARGQQLWRSRFGQLSSVRLAMPQDDAASARTPSDDLSQAQAKLAEGLRQRLDPEAAGFAVLPVRASGLAAAEGSTDFGEYFVYFSFFLIVAALLLAALFFKLGVEQRVREIGTLQAVGFAQPAVRRLFLIEGLVLAAAGSLLGVVGAVGYGEALMGGLRTWWVGAVGTRELYLHLSARDLAVGALVGVLASLGAVLWSLRGLRHTPARALLAGVLESGGTGGRRVRLLAGVATMSALGAVGLMAAAWAGAVADVGGFFGAGGLLLISMLSALAISLRRSHVRPITTPGWLGLVRLGARYVTSRPGRSLLCVALIAFATFVIVSVEAFRKDSGRVDLAPDSGTGGFPLVAESVLPIVHDPNTDEGRDELSIGSADDPEFAQVRFVPFRVRPGEDASCLNLYAPQEPKILGAPPSFIREARFSFRSSLASTDEQARNPWLLLEAPLPDGAIPAIGDANTLQYILHRAVGGEVVVRGDDGDPVRLRLVAALRDSILQGELIVGEADFLRAFPDREGFRFFLVDAPAAEAEALAVPLEEALADWGVSVESAPARLDAYHRVENTYLSTFQSLGALGLVLGTIGLAAILLRNVLERRRELALLRAVGYRGGAISLVIVVENVLLMIAGLACGTVSAVLAILPALLERGGSLPVAASATMLAVVAVGGVLSSLAAVVAVRRMPLLDAIRSE